MNRLTEILFPSLFAEAVSDHGVLEERTADFWYHTTRPEYIQSILKTGLQINSTHPGKSCESLRWMKKAYDGMMPIFFSRASGHYQNGIILKVNLEGIPIVADIPGLLDHDGQLAINERNIFWDEESTPEQLWDIVNPRTGELSFKSLRKPNSKAAVVAIQVTQTCAVMQNVPSDRITVVGRANESAD